ncbi:ClpXP protease specificity-enhancing factor [Candidatus Vallotia cooleyia]|uniref:ClpXP protease specificity-enhancing factor n=1 Tax=Candidatus Vallotiella adelgis TaxID=1177211 RepID=UPI001D0347C4|nr:ClpXP protease specificity-enhancing factor [Candidatus Vallotia cooleyia]UDG82247.1 hypothetical protein GJV44_00504 [Candidatus Vallotia cooleyia]
MQEIPTKPYLLRAIYSWCIDNRFTPHIAVKVDNYTRVPQKFVRNSEIVLNISCDSISQLQMGNDVIKFLARFSGTPNTIEVPVANILAIYASENGQGMAFSVQKIPNESMQNRLKFEAPAPDKIHGNIPSQVKQHMLREQTLQQARIDKPTVRPLVMLYNKEVQRKNVPHLDNKTAADNCQKNGRRKHLKVIK